VDPCWEQRGELPWLEPIPEADLALVEDYERRTTLFPGWPDLLVARLALRPGDTVIDAGAGTGLSLAALRAAVGPDGTVIAVEQSPRLLAVAARRVTLRRWDNVELINAPPATARLSLRADAALFCTAHDVVADPVVVSNIIDQLRPGAAVAAGGWKRPSKWLWPLPALVAALQGPYLADPTELDQPWRALADRVTGLCVREIGFGAGYLAHATSTPAPAPRPAGTQPTARRSGTPLGNLGQLQPTAAPPTRGVRRDPADRCEWFVEQVGGVLDPLARQCTGLPASVVREVLARVWREEFGARLDAAVLSECAAALAEGRSWIHTLWYDGW
jgi:SAM-dependent methyltransferase